MLGFDTYTEGHSDGLQILRYNLTTAYIPHMDWIDDPSGQLAHDYESSGRGGNRFATILLYMSDLGERDGGETVFVKAWPNGQDEKDRVQLPEVRVSFAEGEQRSPITTYIMLQSILCLALAFRLWKRFVPLVMQVCWKRDRGKRKW